VLTFYYQTTQYYYAFYGFTFPCALLCFERQQRKREFVMERIKSVIHSLMLVAAGGAISAFLLAVAIHENAKPTCLAPLPVAQLKAGAK
jgi:hypothetical protein